MTSPHHRSRRASSCQVQLILLSILSAIIFAVMSSGCGKKDEQVEEPGTTGEGASRVSLMYPAALSSQSSPSDVASVLIKALDENDQNTLSGLVATQEGVRAVEGIYRKHGKSGGTTPEKAAALAAAGWRATYSFLKKNETAVKSESIEGERAVVIAEGKTLAGETRTLRIELFREDGVWKVGAGIR